MAGLLDRLKKSGERDKKRRMENLKTRGPQPKKERGFMDRFFDPVRPPKPKKDKK